MVAIVFVVYNGVVEQRTLKLMVNAARSRAIVSSMFPGSIRDKMIEQSLGDPSKVRSVKIKLGASTDDDASQHAESRPLADLFHNCSVILRISAGSLRGPAFANLTKYVQMPLSTPVGKVRIFVRLTTYFCSSEKVFELLETLYQGNSLFAGTRDRGARPVLSDISFLILQRTTKSQSGATSTK
jgi:hypothetical protein